MTKLRNKHWRDAYYERRQSPASRAVVMLCSARVRAKKKGLLFELTKDWVLERLKTGVCEATGIPFVLSGYAGVHPFAPSIDRIDNSKGYTRNNCRVVVWLLNQMRGAYSDELTLYVAQQWMARLPKEGMTHGRRNDD